MRGYGLRVLAGVALLLGVTTVTYGSSSAAARHGGSRWGADYFPNVSLITHEGKSVRFFDDLIKDKVVVINFIYTSCPDSCPLETARLVDVQQILGNRVGRDVFMYSISIDPERDTPDVLKKYAEKFQVDPGWLFLTGNEADIKLLRQKLGLYIEEIQDGSNDHNLSLIIGNQTTGRWMKRSPFENPYYLANQIGSWLNNWKLPDPNRPSYANAPKLRKLSMGENLFRTRCEACHTIGAGDIFMADQRRVGPDLLGVTRKRDGAWLTRWLAEPDKMLEEKDPIVMELYQKYNNVAMPNMRLNKHEVAALIDYMDTESRRVEEIQDASAASSRKVAAPAVDNEDKTIPAENDPATKAEIAALDDVMKPYETCRALLAGDKVDGISGFAHAIEKAGRSGQESLPQATRIHMRAIAAAAATLAGAPTDNLKALRLAFGKVSKSVVALLGDLPKAAEKYHIFKCPMAKGYQRWVQPDAKLANPYMGAKMLACGYEVD